MPSKKRPRSLSRSESPPPKRRADSPADAIRSEIWKLFGKDRTTYVSRDIDSDDDDMEADASAVMKEEQRRLARFTHAHFRNFILSLHIQCSLC